jgi:hypothetical protein
MSLPSNVSQFLIQIVDKTTGEVVVGLEPGSRVETDLINEFVIRVKGIGVGMFKTEAAVEAASRQAWADLLMALKLQVRPPRS